ncbi:MAG: DUF2309 domain-containing protein [Fluviicola sp.]|nr:DUF2309 domain-containing protein [Fluviicola sp.]MBP6271474.1 DUF2309 domain-containing protein [Fluviicola sp.]
MTDNSTTEISDILNNLKHYLPSQAPLKDFIHHNTLHAFQHDSFHDGIVKANEIFGYKVYLEIDEYRQAFQEGKISHEIVDRVLCENVAPDQRAYYRTMMLNGPVNGSPTKRIGSLRANWKKTYKVDMDSRVHANLFRLISSYTDQGIATWNFPVHAAGFLASIRSLEENTYSSFFQSKRTKQLLKDPTTTLEQVLELLLGDSTLFEHYLFDQQFAHPGWSGMVAVLEENPTHLLNSKLVTLHDFIFLECLFEIDVLDDVYGEKWAPMAHFITQFPTPLFAPLKQTQDQLIFKIWQEAYEWSYYDSVASSLVQSVSTEKPLKLGETSFQAFFCMDDRECSFRRHIEAVNPHCETFGTPGHFNLDFFYQPEGGKFHTKCCPVPAQPTVLIKEVENTIKKKRDFHFSKRNQGLFGGVIITTIAGWISPFRLALNIIRPTISPLTSSSMKHMDPQSKLLFEGDGTTFENGLQLGFTIDQMTDRLEGLLKSVGLTSHFASIVYMIGHGSTSVNNTHYAGYDCGACSGRPGSVNARLIALIGNHPEVRKRLRERGIDIPFSTRFIGALQDTSRDEITYYDTDQLALSTLQLHEANTTDFLEALDYNSKERSRRFMSIQTKDELQQVHEKVKRRTVSLFEPRPELNHATNALAIVGRRSITRSIFLDRRSFLNSYDYSIDPQGDFLAGILNAVAPVAGGINLEYYFSRVDNQQLGAGSKLPHNVVGLIGVTNGIEGDLRTGLPYQMIEVHDPIRLLVVVEHDPAIVFSAISRNEATYNWFKEKWVHLMVLHPIEKMLYRFENESFEVYNPIKQLVPESIVTEELFETTAENILPFIIES